MNDPYNVSWRAGRLTIAVFLSIAAGLGGASASAAHATGLSDCPSLLRSGQYDTAARNAEEAIDEARRQHRENTMETAAWQQCLTRAYLASGRYRDARRTAEEALHAREKQLGKDSLETASSLHDLAEAYAGAGDYGKALAPAEQALAIRERLAPDSLAVAESLNDLGVLRLNIKDVDQAAVLIDRARAIREKQLPRESVEIAESLGNSAAVALSQGKRDEARRLFEESLAIKESPSVYGPSHVLVGQSRASLAAVYVGMWRAAPAGEERDQLALKAREHGSAARRILAEGELRGGTATALNNLAWALMAFAPLTNDEVIDLLTQASAANRKVLGKEHPQTIQSDILLATFYRSLGEYRRSLQLFESALPAENTWLAQAMPVGNESLMLDLARRMQGHYLAGLSLVHKHFRNDPEAIRFALDMVLQRKGIVLDVAARLQEGYANYLNGEALQSWRRLVELRNDFSTLLLDGPKGGDEAAVARYQERLAKLTRAIDQEEKALSSRSPQVAQELAQREVASNALAKRLPAGGALVEFVRITDWDEKRLSWSTTSRYLAFVLTASNEVTMIDLGDAKILDGQITRTLATIRDQRAFDDPKAYDSRTQIALAALHKTVFAPLDAAVDKKDPVILSPDGQLAQVPFEALYTPSSHYLVEEHMLSQVSSGRDLMRQAGAPVIQPEVLVVANPAFNQASLATSRASRSGEGERGTLRLTFQDLPGTLQEAQAIRPLMRGNVEMLTGEEATESAVREVRRPQVLHLATHGFFRKQESASPADPTGRSAAGGTAPTSTDPLRRSGLALAGASHSYVDTCDEGILCANEVEEMNLFGTELVVLSACETALGDIEIGEGVYGLRRAFVLAGARNLIMSLWPVDDEVTRDLMKSFYRHYQSGTSPVAALHQAQLDTIASLRLEGKDNQGIAMVNLWAPFIIQETGNN